MNYEKASLIYLMIAFIAIAIIFSLFLTYIISRIGEINPNACEIITGKERMKCYAWVASYKGDESFCEKGETEQLKSICYYNVALSSKSSETNNADNLCTKISEKSARECCLAFNSDDGMGICDELENQKARDVCRWRFTVVSMKPFCSDAPGGIKCSDAKWEFKLDDFIDCAGIDLNAKPK